MATTKTKPEVKTLRRAKQPITVSAIGNELGLTSQAVRNLIAKNDIPYQELSVRFWVIQPRDYYRLAEAHAKSRKYRIKWVN